MKFKLNDESTVHSQNLPTLIILKEDTSGALALLEIYGIIPSCPLWKNVGLKFARKKTKHKTPPPRRFTKNQQLDIRQLHYEEQLSQHTD